MVSKITVILNISSLGRDKEKILKPSTLKH